MKKFTKDQQLVIDTIKQLTPINVYRVLVVATTLQSMQQEQEGEKQ